MPLYSAASPLAMPVAGQYYFTSSPHGSAVSATLTNGALRLVPWIVTRATAIDRIGSEVTVVGDVGSKIRLGLYADNGACYPGALVLDAGQIAGDSATVQELTCALSLAPGLYWVGGVVQAVTTTQPTVRIPSAWTPPVLISAGTGIPAVAATTFGYQQGSITGALPGTFTTGVNGIGSAPRVFVRAA
jgi:hypothetical protein